MIRFGFLVIAFITLTTSTHEAPADAHHTNQDCQPFYPDGDGDGLGVTCDPVEQDSDADNDGARDSLEIYVGTNPLNNCSFPNDMNGSQHVNTIDVGYFIQIIGSFIHHDTYDARFDLNANEIINTIDVGTFTSVLGQHCPVHPGLIGAPALHFATEHFHPAPRWNGSVMYINNVDDQYWNHPVFCERLRVSAAVWSDDHLSPSVVADDSLTVRQANPENCLSMGFPAVDVEILPLDGPAASYQGFDQNFDPCSSSDPCAASYAGHVRVDEDFYNTYGTPYIRSALAHEFGHAIGLGHPSGGDPSYCSDWTVMFTIIDCDGDGDPTISPLRNDVLFQHLKY